MNTELKPLGRLNYLVVFFLAIIVFLLLFTLAWINFQKNANQQFVVETSSLNEEFHNHIAIGKSALDSVSSLFSAIPYIDAEAFRVVSNRYLKSQVFISSIVYFSYTDSEQRGSFEEDMRALGYADFSIKQSINSQLAYAQQSDYYLPLMFIEPFSVKNIMLLGLDANAEAEINHSINTAINNNTTLGVMTRGLFKQLSQYFLFKPLYAGKSALIKQSVSRKDLRGVVAVGFDLSRLLKSLKIPAHFKVELFETEKESKLISSVNKLTDDRLVYQMVQKIKPVHSFYPFTLRISKSVTLQELPVLPFFVAALLGTIVTVLMLIVARVNQKRNSELINRNIEINHRVDLKTRDLNQAKAELEKSMLLLQNSERKYRSLIKTTLEGFWMFDMTFHIVDVNQSLCKMLGYDRDYLVGKSIYEFVNEQDKLILKEQSELIKKTDNQRYEISLISSENIAIPVIFEVTTSKEATGKLIGAFAFITDISERKQSEEKLKLSASVFIHASEGIVITNCDSEILDVNNSFSRITGYSREEVLGKNPGFLSSGHQDKDYYKKMWSDILEKGYWSGEIWNRRKSGEVYAQMLSIDMIKDDQGKPMHYVGLFFDITSQKEHQRQLEYFAHYDALTKLPNRVLLADRLIQSMIQVQRRGLQLAVAFIDLDGFKEVNDSYGHDMGDQLLMNLAVRYKEVLREGDSIARVGGDEFVAILIDLAGEQDCIPLVQRLLAASAQPLRIKDLELKVSSSIGISFYPQSEKIDGDQLLRQADQAMYQAKLSGKNRYQLFDTIQDRSLRGWHENIERARQALENNEFILHYQPKVNLQTGDVYGVEALIRWQSPRHGMIYPGDFLPDIKDSSLAIELDEWVLKTALQQLANWHQKDLKLSLSVNIGPQLLQCPDFIEKIEKQLSQYSQFENHYLELEVLETSALEDIEHVSKIIKSCQKIGVRFALDDFGTGYSSLTYLKRLPVQTLKIDRSFVIDMLDNVDDLAILEGILGLSGAFRCDVVAEGVETIEHGIFLLELGCMLAQGYGIARPMAVETLEKWINDWQLYPEWQGVKKVDNKHLSLVYAIVDHRHWMRELKEYIEGKIETPPPLSEKECRLGNWLNGSHAQFYNSLPSFDKILSLHTEIHELCTELCEMAGKEQLDNQQIKQAGYDQTSNLSINLSIDKLNYKRDVMIKLLQQLLKEAQSTLDNPTV